MDKNKDKLDKIFDLQAALDLEIQTKRNLNFSKSEWIQKEILAIISELSEVLDEVNFKWWKKDEEIDDEKLHEEIIDVLHFFISMCLRAGLDSETLFRLYEKKNSENLKRQHGKSTTKNYEEV
ncbi:MAG: dUTPase [Clostridiales bacterium]|nr:dUTPase [Clostridiales bacterium]